MRRRGWRSPWSTWRRCIPGCGATSKGALPIVGGPIRGRAAAIPNGNRGSSPAGCRSWRGPREDPFRGRAHVGAGRTMEGALESGTAPRGKSTRRGMRRPPYFLTLPLISAKKTSEKPLRLSGQTVKVRLPPEVTPM